MSRPAKSPPTLLPLIVVEFLDLSIMTLMAHPPRRPARKLRICGKYCIMKSPILKILIACPSYIRNASRKQLATSEFIVRSRRRRLSGRANRTLPATWPSDYGSKDCRKSARRNGSCIPRGRIYFAPPPFRIIGLVAKYRGGTGPSLMVHN